MTDKIRLGDKVKCKYTGFTGIVTAKTIFINGCVQFSITPRWDKKLATEILLTEMSIDENSLIIVDKKLRKPTKQEIIKAEETLDELEDEEEDKDTGGALRRSMGRRNY